MYQSTANKSPKFKSVLICTYLLVKAGITSQILEIDLIFMKINTLFLHDTFSLPVLLLHFVG